MTSAFRQLLAAILCLLLAVPVFSSSDRFTAGDTYDANGYDFENRLIQKGGVTLVYDGDGNRVSKTVAGITTTYLVDTQNPTGYAQVLQEQFNGAGPRELLHTYVYGLEAGGTR